MEYYYSLQDTHNYTHSIDNVCVSYYLKCSLNKAIELLHEKGKVRSTYYENLAKLGCSKWSFYQNHFHYDDGIYIKLGKYKIYIEDTKKVELLPIIQFEINPNKHANKESFQECLEFIKENCTDGHLDKYDYAIDIPLDFDDIQVFGSRKEKGLYKGTRYYGQRNKHGYCKIYDKGKEQKLVDTLTRVEHTLCDKDNLSLEKFYVRNCAAETDLSELPTSTRVYVELCLEIKQLGGDYESIISKLHRNTQSTLRKYLTGGFIQYEYDLDILDKLLKSIYELFNVGYKDAYGFMHCIDEPLPFD